MCVPILGLTAAQAATAALAITAVATVAKAANVVYQAKQQNEAAQENLQSATDSYFLKTTINYNRYRQEQRQAAQLKDDADLKSLKAQSTALAAAAGANVQGPNVEQLINDFERSEGVYNSRVDTRLEDIQRQIELNNLGFQTEAINRINSVQPVSYAEQIFGVADAVGDFGISYFDTQARFASID